ncbi:MAG: enoyl-CoA hydratase/isomerase family protein [Anaerolineae bacterium]|nr:enoyl-CoA hydratase/isomerase family protein [Anaerolineae bacterium]
MSEEIELTQVGAVLTVALNRPAVHNAMTPGMIQQLTAVFRDLNTRDDMRVVVLTGHGRTFCAGADLGHMLAAGQFSLADNVRDAEAIFDLMLMIEQCQKPVVGRVNGTAVGGGVGLVSCCDIVVAVSRAKFSFSEVHLGLVPAVISPFVLAKTGATHGRELFLTGERFPAERAREAGLVQYVVSDQELDAKVNELVTLLLAGAPGAQAAVKQLVRTVTGRPKEEVREYTANLIAQRRNSDEGLEGMSAFLQKRKPAWQEDQL